MTPKDFISAVTPAAKTSAAKTNIPASFTVAQSALESAWGSRAPGFNLFGIKADASWHGAVVAVATHESINGKSVPITANFRAYADWLGSISDHAAFLKCNPRYQPAFAHTDGVGFARAIAAAGYATDPLYGQKLVSIIAAHDLAALDVV
jgi:flagellum-specific peptidoglycan hydrolase FlgJ